MGKVKASATPPVSQEPSNYDEVFMHQSLLFDDSLKDLKNLRSQLYSAAEYFELSYTNDDQKQIVVETLKDYAIKALVNTVDHLGSVTYKVNDLLDEKVVEVSGAELRVSCIEQRMRMYQEYTDHKGRTQQSLVISTPKYHKRYILPVGETMVGANCTKSKYLGCTLDDEDEWPHFRNAVRATIREMPTSTARKERSQSPAVHSQRPGAFSFTSTMPKKDLGCTRILYYDMISQKFIDLVITAVFLLVPHIQFSISQKGSRYKPNYCLNLQYFLTCIEDKRSVSPYRFPLLRSGSRSATPKMSRQTTPKPSRPTTPNPSNARQRYPSEPRKSASMRLSVERDDGKDVEQYPSKSKRLLKALLSRRKSKKDDTLYTYLDEY